MVDARESEKDPDAFRTISEVADELSLPQHVLRFWETRFHQVKPVKRAGGRRFYRPEDVDLLRGIRRLLYEEGFTIKGAQKILKDQGVRHVQDLGIEGDVATIRNAVDPETRNPSAEGKSFGGFLGLLPLRRGKSQETQREEPLPTLDEPPLPFEELGPMDMFAPENEDPPAPPRGRATSQRVEERRFDGSVYEERIVEERRFESEVVPLSEAVSHLPHDSFDDEEPAYDEAEDDTPAQVAPPSFAPAPARELRSGGRQRIEPALQMRPSRGPAAHIASPARPEFQDTLLPFMDDDSPDETESEALENRIRRMKEHEPRRANSAPPVEDRPPAEYVPQRHRHGIDPDAEHAMMRHMEEDDLPSVVRGALRESGQDPRMTDRPVREHPAAQPPRMRAPAHEQAAPSLAPEVSDYRGGRYSEPRPETAAPPPDFGLGPMRMAGTEPLPQARRFGPFTEPVVEEFELPPVDMRRAANGRAVWEEQKTWEEEYSEPRLPPESYRALPCSERLPPAAAPRMRYGMDSFGNEAGAPPAPPSYGEGRRMGQGVMPVLSREDIHRLQAALYELSECQRLMESLLDDAKD